MSWSRVLLLRGGAPSTGDLRGGAGQRQRQQHRVPRVLGRHCVEEVTFDLPGVQLAPGRDAAVPPLAWQVTLPLCTSRG